MSNFRFYGVLIAPDGTESPLTYGEPTPFPFTNSGAAIKACAARIYGEPLAFWNSERESAERTRQAHKGFSYRIEERFTRPAFRVTYDIVTPESACHGDTAENGFIGPSGDRIPALIGKPTPGVEMTLREALALASPDSDCGRWITESDGRLDHATGATETRAIHPPRNITPASYRRLLALLEAS